MTKTTVLESSSGGSSAHGDAIPVVRSEALKALMERPPAPAPREAVPVPARAPRHQAEYSYD